MRSEGFYVNENSTDISWDRTSDPHSTSAPKDGQNYRQKHVELIEIINKIVIVASGWLFMLLYSVTRGHTNIGVYRNC